MGLIGCNFFQEHGSGGMVGQHEARYDEVEFKTC